MRNGTERQLSLEVVRNFFKCPTIAYLVLGS